MNSFKESSISEAEKAIKKYNEQQDRLKKMKR